MRTLHALIALGTCLVCSPSWAADEPAKLSTLAQAGGVLGGEVAMASASAGLTLHTLSLRGNQNLALTKYLAELYHRDMRNRLNSKHWLLPTLKDLSGAVTRDGVVVMNLDEEKEARLLPTLNLSTFGAKVRIRF